MSKITTALWGLASLLFICVGAHAATSLDGVTLIDETTITAAGGYPYQITKPGSYRLSGNLTVPGSEDAIHILADGVTLDLGGFSITASGYGASCCAIYDMGGTHTGNSVRNGSITGFYQAILLQGCDFCAVQQLILVNNWYGIFLGTNSLVSANVLGCPGVAASASDGGTEGILLYGSAVVSGNTISGFTIGLNPGANSLVSGNTVTGNQQGMLFVGPTNVVGNFLGGNDQDFSGLGSSDYMFNNNPKS
jgi:hypothetical protein